MNRAALPILAALLVTLGLAIYGVAWSLETPAVSVARETVVVTATAPNVRAATHTPTATATATVTRTATPLPNCHLTLFEGSVCTWPSNTPTVPLPACQTPDAGQACVRQGAAVVTMVGLKP